MTGQETRWLLTLAATAMALGACGDHGQSARDNTASAGTAPTSATGGTGGAPTKSTGGSPAAGTGGSATEHTGGTPGGSAGTGEPASVTDAGGADAGITPPTGGATATVTGGALSSSGAGGDSGALEPARSLDDLFQVRQPQTRTLDCSVKMTQDLPAQQVSDADQVCTFSHDGVTGYLYLQATVVDCEYYYALVGWFSSRAWIGINGEVIELEGPQYSLNGDHFTDALSFTYAGKHYYYWHSSFSEYYRSCQPMDCMRVYDAATGVYDSSTLLEDGCLADRTLPVVCVAVQPDGTFPPLEDNYAPCPGSEDWQPTPVGG